MIDEGRTLEAFESDWAALAAHHARGALFLVAAEADPLAIARAVAADAVDEVRGHLEAQRLRRPSADEVERFAAAPSEHRFVFYIVQPYVVAQPLERGAEA